MPSNPRDSGGSRGLSSAGKGAFDLDYSKRHSGRNILRVRDMLRNIPTSERILDLGCNEGYLSLALLQNEKARFVDAVELDASVVNRSLLERPDFKLTVGSVTDFSFPQRYDGIVYNAVHHHVVSRFGHESSLDVWRKVIDHAKHFIVFETGLIAEAGDWDWKQALNDQYEDDGAHLGALLRAIGPRLKEVRVMGWHSIHRVRRPLLIIELEPPLDEQNVRLSPYDWRIIDRFRRTVGSRNQTLINEADWDGIAGTYHGTIFSRLASPKGDEAFAKHAYGNPYKTQREYVIAQQIDHPKAATPIEINPEFGIVYPYVPWQPLASILGQPLSGMDQLAEGIFEFLDYAERKTIELGDLQYSRFKREGRKLIDLIDVHSGNILVGIEGSSIKDWKFIDFEYYSNTNAVRNWRTFLEFCRSVHVGDRRLLRRVRQRLLVARLRQRVTCWRERFIGDWPDASVFRSYEITERMPVRNGIRERTRLACASLRDLRFGWD